MWPSAQAPPYPTTGFHLKAASRSHDPFSSRANGLPHCWVAGSTRGRYSHPEQRKNLRAVLPWYAFVNKADSGPTIMRENPTMWCSGVIFSVLGLEDLETYRCSAVYLFCRREYDGSRTILYIGEAEDVGSRMARHEKLSTALALGMNEFHVHLLARTKAARLEVETHLRHRYPTPLNDQVPSLQALGWLNALAPPPPTNALLGALSPQPPTNVLSSFMR